MKTQNNTITEDYVSFETAKLLNTKGFDLPTYMVWYEHLPLSIGGSVNVGKTALDYFYYNEATEHQSLYNNKKKKPNYVSGDIYSAPTLQMAMKWLRIKGVVIVIRYEAGELGIDNLELNRFYWVIYPDCGIKNWSDNYKTYEEACEEAIKYCLTHFINN